MQGAPWPQAEWVWSPPLVSSLACSSFLHSPDAACGVPNTPPHPHQ